MPSKIPFAEVTFLWQRAVCVKKSCEGDDTDIGSAGKQRIKQAILEARLRKLEMKQQQAAASESSGEISAEAISQ
jgi:hypothetical protein